MNKNNSVAVGVLRKWTSQGWKNKICVCTDVNIRIHDNTYKLSTTL